MGVTVLQSQKRSASLHPAHSESVLQTGISPLDSDYGAGALGLDLVDGKVAATNSMPTGVPNLGCNKMRHFIQENSFQTGETASSGNQKFSPPRQRGGPLM